MIADFHFLRPWWLSTLFLLALLAWKFYRQKPRLHAWAEICDAHLLAHLTQKKGSARRVSGLWSLFLSIFLLILSISGPTWHKLPVATYKPLQPRVLVLDMSDNMLIQDLNPDRLSRAKFKLHDLFAHKDIGQFALVAFTAEPFIVSPLTDDGQTISALLSSLTPDVMPIKGQNLESALQEASQLIKHAGYHQGQILILTADSPSPAAINLAHKIAQMGITSSIMPIKNEANLNPLFQSFANAGQGQLVQYRSDSKDLEQWIQAGINQQFMVNKEEEMPQWRDEGRWFLIPALFFFLPVFQRGWLQRLTL